MVVARDGRAEEEKNGEVKIPRNLFSLIAVSSMMPRQRSV
jgi:hypothetical protein